jgi:hypothetical protein
MTKFLAANNAITTLASDIGPSSTTVQVATGAGALFPAPGAGQEFALTVTDAATGLINEIMYVTAVSGDTFTVVRGQEGTTALSWHVGDKAANLWTAGQMQSLPQLADVQQQAGNYAVDTGSANAMTATLNPAITAYSQITGTAIRIKKAADNTSGVTLNLNGIAPIAVVLPSGGAIPSGALSAGGIIEVVYDGTEFQLTGLPSVVPPGGTAGGDLAGSYPNPVIGANKVTVGKMAQAPALTVLSNLTGATSNMAFNSVADLLAALGIDIDLSNVGSSSGGWAEFTSGDTTLYVQWATVVPGDDSYVVYGLPRAFPNAFLGAVATVRFNDVPPKSGGNGGGAFWYPVSLSTIGIGIAWDGDATGINTVFYVAFGL